MNNETINLYYKLGGSELLRQFWNNGVIGTAMAQFILMGKGKTALELLRLSVQLKTKQRLEKKYRKVIERFDSELNENRQQKARKTVWVFWWQGEDSMPYLVRKCYESVKNNFSNWEIVLLTEKNYDQYAEFPDYITDKIQKGISLTHFSDLLRLELLIKYGGLWLDATVLCTSKEIPTSILNSDLFMFRPLKPGADGRAITVSSWMIWAKSNNKILMSTQHMLYAYWRKKKHLDDYFLLHHFLSISLDYYSRESKLIPSFCNSIPHILLLHLFEKYDEKYWEDLKQMCSFHKLSYKLDEKKCNLKGTYYEKILNFKENI